MNQRVQSRSTVHGLIATYSESHQNPVNEIIHFICVPAIVLSALGLFWAIHPFVAVATTLAALAYYAVLSTPLAIGMLLMAGTMLGALALLPGAAVLPLSIATFVIAWIGQFIGHRIEGKKPSFLDDLRFLLVGPLFVLSFLYRRLHVPY